MLFSFCLIAVLNCFEYTDEMPINSSHVLRDAIRARVRLYQMQPAPNADTHFVCEKQ